MKMKSVYKVPDGKLIKIFLEYNLPMKTIKSIIIAGDFFAYPEESIQQLEQLLQGTPLDEKRVETMIKDFVKDNQVEFIGVSPASITDAIMRCK
jgi:hypothetical protein